MRSFHLEPSNHSGDKRVSAGRIAAAVTAVILTLGLVGYVASQKSSIQISTPSVTDTPTQSASTSKPSSEFQTLLELSGSGTKSTQKFTASSDWDLQWSYDCSSFGQQGNFAVQVYNSDATASVENTALNQLGKSGSDIQHYHKGGAFYLNVISECSWHVTVKG